MLWPLIVLGFAAALVLVGARLSRKRGYILRERDQIVCPITREPVKLTLIEDVAAGRVLDVKHCSGPAHGRCDKDCLPLINNGISLHPL